MSPSSAISADFRFIFGTALDGYAKQTGIDLPHHPSAHELENCNTSEDILWLLQDRDAAFQAYREKNRKLINYFRPVIQIVHAFSGILRHAPGLVSFRDLLHIMLFIPMNSLAIRTHKSNLCRH
jgi:hypothetical protein